MLYFTTSVLAFSERGAKGRNAVKLTGPLNLQ